MKLWLSLLALGMLTAVMPVVAADPATYADQCRDGDAVLVSVGPACVPGPWAWCHEDQPLFGVDQDPTCLTAGFCDGPHGGASAGDEQLCVPTPDVGACESRPEPWAGFCQGDGPDTPLRASCDEPLMVFRLGTAGHEYLCVAAPGTGTCHTGDEVLIVVGDPAGPREDTVCVPDPWAGPNPPYGLCHDGDRVLLLVGDPGGPREDQICIPNPLPNPLPPYGLCHEDTKVLLLVGDPDGPREETICVPDPRY